VWCLGLFQNATRIINSLSFTNLSSYWQLSLPETRACHKLSYVVHPVVSRKLKGWMALHSEVVTSFAPCILQGFITAEQVMCTS
jgi:hypothetical protein